MRPLLFLAAISLAGCVTLPRETVELNQRVSVDIADLEQVHMALLDEYGAQRRARVDDFLKYEWTPQFIMTFLKKAAVKKAFKEKVCKSNGELDRAKVIQDAVEVIAKQVERRRLQMYAAVNEAVRALREPLRTHYAHIAQMNNTVTSNLQTVSERLELEKAARVAIAKPLDKIVPISKTSAKLDAIFKEPQ